MAIRAMFVSAAIALAPAIAFAQAGPAGPPAPPASPAPSAQPAPSASVTTPATGYGWSKTPAKHGRSPRAGARPEQPDDVLAGFEELSDGGSRFYVELAKSVPVDEQKAPGTLTYVLHGAHVKLRNNKNALVTVHFNTPAIRARLVPHGKDLLFVIELRAQAAATWRVIPGKDGTAILQVDFPKGDYLSGAPLAPAPAPAPAASAPPTR